jgi:competence protein ComEC
VRVLLTVEGRVAPKQGDAITFTTRLKRPTWYKNPGSPHYRHQLDRKGIFLKGWVTSTNWSIREASQSRPSFLNSTRLNLREKIDSYSSPPGANLLKALLLGDRTELRPSDWDLFRKSGTLHLLSISGQHVALLFGFSFLLLFTLLKQSTWLLLRYSARRLASLISLLPILIYVIVAGGEPPALRALIIIILLVLALNLRRDIDLFSSLALAVS